MTDDEREVFIKEEKLLLSIIDDLLDNKENSLYTREQLKTRVSNLLVFCDKKLNDLEDEKDSEISNQDIFIKELIEKIDEFEENKETVEQVIEDLESLIFNIKANQVKMITDVDYYCESVQKLKNDGLLPNYNLVKQLEKEARKIVNLSSSN